MNNWIIKTLAYNQQVRILFMDNTKLVQEICNPKNSSKLLKNTLGLTVSVASLLSGTLKGTQRISLRINASTSAFKMFADADSNGNVRGYLSDGLINAPQQHAADLTIEKLIGDKGYIQVMKDLGMNNIFTGITEMPYGNIVDDVSHYFRQSEQIPTHLGVNMAFDKNNDIMLSKGIFVQLLPGAPSRLMDVIKQILAANPLILTHPLPEEEVLGLFDDAEVVGRESVQFYCGCSKEMFYGILHSLSKEEIADSIHNNTPIETICNICGQRYSFGQTEIKQLLQND